MAGYLGNIPSAVPLTSADIADGIITSAKIADGTIVNADINASSAIALSKLSTTGTADATTFLRGDGAYTAVSSDFVLLATTNASNVASVTFDGYFSSTYENYIILVSDFYAGTNNVSPKMRFRRSNSDVTASNYAVVSLNHQTSGADSQVQTGQSSFDLFGGGAGNMGNTSTNGNARTITIFNPLSTTTNKVMTYYGWSVRYDGNIFTHSASCQLSDNANALSGVSFFASSGNIYGKFKLYGLK
jgi:hypothetical protein